MRDISKLLKKHGLKPYDEIGIEASTFYDRVWAWISLNEIFRRLSEKSPAELMRISKALEELAAEKLFEERDSHVVAGSSSGS